MKLKQQPDPATDAAFEAVWRLGEMVDSYEADNASTEAAQARAACRWEGAMASLAAALLAQERIGSHHSGPLGPDVYQGDVQQADVLLWAWAVRSGRVPQEAFDKEIASHWALKEALEKLEAAA